MGRKPGSPDDGDRGGQERDKGNVRAWCPSAHTFQESLPPSPCLSSLGMVLSREHPRQEDTKGKELYVPAGCVTGRT